MTGLAPGLFNRAPCPRCREPRGTLRRVEGCACRALICRCEYGGRRVHLLEDAACDGCVLQRIAWRMHAVSGFRDR